MKIIKTEIMKTRQGVSAMEGTSAMEETKGTRKIKTALNRALCGGLLLAASASSTAALFDRGGGGQIGGSFHNGCRHWRCLLQCCIFRLASSLGCCCCCGRVSLQFLLLRD